MRCRVCNNIEDNTLYEVKEMMFGLRDVFDYFQCSLCRCLQICEIPPDMSRYYRPDYYSFYQTTKNERDNCGNFLEKLFKCCRDDYAIFNKGCLGKLVYSKFPNRGLRETVALHFPGEDPRKILARKARILDVGCGAGAFLCQFADAGFKNLLGVDPYLQNDINYAGGLNILKKTIYNLDEEFDLIMFHHSFEHMEDPIETLKAVFRLLSRKGICIIRLPIVDSYAWQKYRQEWVQLDAPRHFMLHSIKSLKIAASKAGLKLNKIVYDSSGFQFWGSEQYIKDIPLVSDNSYYVNVANSIFKQEEMDMFENLAKKLNLENNGDQAAFYLEKQN